MTEIILQKLKIAQKRSISNLLNDYELVARIINEDPISIPDALSKYEISNGFIHGLINNNLLSTFSNSIHQGSKKYIFENELIQYLPYYYKGSVLSMAHIDKKIKLILEIGEKTLTEREFKIYREAILFGNSLERIGESSNLTRENTRQIVEKAGRRLQFMVSSMKTYEKIKSETDLLEIEYQDLKDKIKKFKLKNKNILPEALSDIDPNEKWKKVNLFFDLDFSVRLNNCFKCIEAETVYDILQITRKDFLNTRNLGKRSLMELEEYLEKNGLSFKK